MSLDAPVTIAGVDGCKAGWVAVVKHPAEPPNAKICVRFAELIDALPPDAVIAVDMPIGLPAFTRHGGRGPEAIVRKLLGHRQSSVFSIPSRSAVYAADEDFTSIDRWYQAHRTASEIARNTSDPPRGVSIQAFGIFSKIREIDRQMRARPELRERVIESHPEVGFWRLAGSAMSSPKKIRGRVNPAGMEERRNLLALHGFERPFLYLPPPRGAADDDYLDACAMCAIAARRARGEAVPFPSPPDADAFAIPIAIWA